MRAGRASLLHATGFLTTTAAALAVFASHPAAAQQKSDSARVHRRVVRAQERFESVRRQNLPFQLGGRDPHRCDARIGRFCQWNSEDDTVEAKDPRSIRRARAALLATLDSAAAKSPRDGWITGQRLRYLLESGNDTAAVRVANECQASEWWCAALQGLALHETASGAGSDSAFTRALRAMPASERCRWTDMSPILDADQRKRFGRVGCGRNEEVAERLWWMADPFWSLAGNDRRTEHYARHTMARILEPARNTFNLRWANDMREMIVRYGWARYWTRDRGSSMDPYNGPISGHEATPNYHFIPVSLRLDSVPVVAFDLDTNASAERYAPVMAERVFKLDPQVAVFRRGDSALVVVAYDVSHSADLDSSRVGAALVIARNENSSPYIGFTEGTRSAVSVIVDSRPAIMSLEVIATEKRRAAWKRTGLMLSLHEQGAVTMSDVLLFEPGESEAGDLGAAMKTAIGGTEVARRKLGLYWEAYGLVRTDSALPVSLTLTRVPAGALRRLGESIGLASRSSPLKISWHETAALGSVTARSVVLDLSLIPKGKYVLRIEAGDSGGQRAATTRNIELR